MSCHFWVNGRNSPPLAYTSAYTSARVHPCLACIGSAVQENSPHPWPTSNPTLRDIRPTMALPSCIGGEGGEGQGRGEFMGGEQLVVNQIVARLADQWAMNGWAMARRSCLARKYQLAHPTPRIPNSCSSSCSVTKSVK